MTSRGSGYRARRPPLGVVSGVAGLTISIIGYSYEVSGIAIRSIVVAAVGTAATTAVGAILAMTLTLRARRRWVIESRLRGKRALTNLREKRTQMAADPILQAALSDLFDAAVSDVVEQAEVGRDEIASCLLVGNPELSSSAEHVPQPLFWREGDWPSTMTVAQLAASAGPSISSGLPQVAELKDGDTGRPVLVVPLVGEADGPSMGAFVMLGLLEHATDNRTEDAVSALLNWAKLVTITLGRELQIRSGTGESGEVKREADS